ncbi:hypothetical protein JOB18_006371 [Solea senegalensis]|uniref:Uncharacterized protein n=1 Tax=Solea senegalensis TaxID=28829 RepID=A0AAV6R8M7_SOLSE|nr:hypothetical protein JOB18_006371 [Solea senegalensis]
MPKRLFTSTKYEDQRRDDERVDVRGELKWYDASNDPLTSPAICWSNGKKEVTGGDLETSDIKGASAGRDSVTVPAEDSRDQGSQSHHFPRWTGFHM